MIARTLRLTAAQIELILKRNGFEFVSQKGSHRKWRNYESGRMTVVPFHGNKVLPIGVLKGIMLDAGLAAADWQ